MKLEVAIKLVLACAALVAAGTYAADTFLDRAPNVAAGVDTADGYEVLGLGFNQQGGYICVSKMSPDPLEDGKMSHTLTFYELRRQGSDGEAKLFYVGSRSMAYDSGLQLMKFRDTDDKDYSPKALKEAIEKAQSGKSKRK